MNDPSSLKQAGELLRAHGLRPQKRLGQNFLCDRNILDKIALTAQLTPEDTVLEIGGGLGALTLTLAPLAASLTVIEIDNGLVPVLRQVVQDRPNVQIIHADFLRLDRESLFRDVFGSRPGVVIANIPYYITTPILEILFEYKSYLRRIVMLVQKEFAARLIAAPGSDDYGAMSLFAQYHTRVELVGTVPRTVFLPQPEVESAIIAFSPVHPGTVTVQSESRLFYVIRAAFGQRRKTLLNALLRAPASFQLGLTMDDREKAEAILLRAGIDGNRRGETLSLEEFARLADAF
jgi:16S rRNA (adenine1518-N6/adenine1519-N6)-dimethyltransferase